MAAIVNILKMVLPYKIFKHIRILWYAARNELVYLETHLTDHCNLNCKSCSHFSPISPEKFTDFDAFSRSIRRLKELFANIRIIRLMGGEPLLHPRVNDFLITVRSAFPLSEIHLVTNGILLARMTATFWETCAGTGTIVDVTRYPIALDLGPARTAAAAHGVFLCESTASKFHNHHMNRKGDSCCTTTFKACSFCPYLDSDSGRVHVCAASALAPIYNEYFNEDLQVSAGDSISIYDDITSRNILKLLNTPISFCRYCTTRKTLFEWDRSSLAREEWFNSVISG